MSGLAARHPHVLGALLSVSEPPERDGAELDPGAFSMSVLKVCSISSLMAVQTAHRSLCLAGIKARSS